MRVSAKAEYACLAVLELAAHAGDPQPVPVKVLADAHGIPQRFLVQILLQLKGNGLVVSSRGALGGYQLARPPEEISLADVIHVIDPPQKHGQTPSAPPSAAAKALHSVWKDIQAEERRILAETNFADLVRRTEEKSVSSYQI